MNVHTLFTVETRDNKKIQNIKNLEECFKLNPNKIYEVTFGESSPQLMVYYNENKKEYIFNWLPCFFSLEALKQLKLINSNNDMLSLYTAKYLNTEIKVLSNEVKCDFIVTKRVKDNQIKSKYTSQNLYDVIKDMNFTNISLYNINLDVVKELYIKNFSLGKNTPSHIKYLEYLKEINK